jgi:hypothetical protein
MNKFVDVLGSGIDNIKIKYNFLTEKEHFFVLNFLNNINDNKPKDVMHYRSNDLGFEMPIDLVKMSIEIKKRIMSAASEMYGREFVEGPKQIPLSFTIHSVGSYSDAHTDILENWADPQKPGNPELVGWRDGWDGYLACNIYINDNYEGGQVYFPEIPYEIKPVANSLIMWAGNKNYIHGVKDPITANRYTWTTWIKFKDFEQYN